MKQAFSFHCAFNCSKCKDFLKPAEGSKTQLLFQIRWCLKLAVCIAYCIQSDLVNSYYIAFGQQNKQKQMHYYAIKIWYLVSILVAETLECCNSFFIQVQFPFIFVYNLILWCYKIPAPPQRLQNSGHFSTLKISGTFQIFFSLKKLD